MNEKTLHNIDLKVTKSRMTILNELEKISYPITAEQLYKNLSKYDIDLSTIYRSLNAFEKKKLIRKEINSNKENVYFLNNKEDKHILVCKKCHKRIKLATCPYHEVNKKLEEETGFQISDQNIEIYGLCKECKKKE